MCVLHFESRYSRAKLHEFVIFVNFCYLRKVRAHLHIFLIKCWVSLWFIGIAFTGRLYFCKCLHPIQMLQVCKNNLLFPIELQCMVNLYYLNMPHFSGSHKILSILANSSSLCHGKTLFCFCITSTKLMIWALMISPHLSIPIMQFYLSCRLE